MTQFIDESSEAFTEAPETNKPGLLTTLLLLLLLAAMLTTLLWPLLRQPAARHRLPLTPTASFLQEA